MPFKNSYMKIKLEWLKGFKSVIPQTTKLVQENIRESSMALA